VDSWPLRKPFVSCANVDAHALKANAAATEERFQAEIRREIRAQRDSESSERSSGKKAIDFIWEAP
jgi:hypothetical protein